MIENDLPETVQQTAFKDIQAGGDIAVGDITQIAHQTVMQQKPDFFEPSLTRYKSINFPSPQITTKLIARINKQRLLVLSGSSDVDKESLARHLASCLLEEATFSGREIAVKEWYRSSDPQSKVLM